MLAGVVAGAGVAGAATAGAEVVGAADSLDAGFASVLVVLAAGLAGSFFLLSRKSVTYQPLPFKAKPGAVNCFEYVSAPHFGHLVSAASAIFCITSSAWPHVAHL